MFLAGRRSAPAAEEDAPAPGIPGFEHSSPVPGELYRLLRELETNRYRLRGYAASYEVTRTGWEGIAERGTIKVVPRQASGESRYFCERLLDHGPRGTDLLVTVLNKTELLLARGQLARDGTRRFFNVTRAERRKIEPRGVLENSRYAQTPFDSLLAHLRYEPWWKVSRLPDEKAGQTTLAVIRLDYDPQAAVGKLPDHVLRKRPPGPTTQVYHLGIPDGIVQRIVIRAHRAGETVTLTRTFKDLRVNLPLDEKDFEFPGGKEGFPDRTAELIKLFGNPAAEEKPPLPAPPK